MDWITGSKPGEIKKLISQLADSARREEAAQGLIKREAESVPLLLAALQTQDLNLLLIYQQILARIPSATPALVNLLASAHPLIRGRVVEIFMISRDKASIPALMASLKGEYFTVRSRAARALADMGDASVVPALLPLLKDEEDDVRIAACAALGKFRDPATFDELANILLDDPKIEARQSAARALGDTKHPVAIPFLMEALRDPFWWYEREQAASDLLNAIENMGTAVVLPLIEALSDREGAVRKFAAVILGKLRDPGTLEELGTTIYDLHHEVSRAAAESLAKFGPPAIDILVRTLHHAEADIRVNSVLGLGKIQDVRVAPILIEMLQDPDRVVRKQTILSLGELRDQRALQALQPIAGNRADREMSALAKDVIARIQT